MTDLHHNKSHERVTRIEECAVCMKVFNQTDQHLMVTEIITDAGVNNSKTPHSVKVISINEALAYVYGISNADSGDVLLNILRRSRRVPLSETVSNAQLVTCLQCGGVLAKLYLAFSALRKLTKEMAISSQVYTYQQENMQRRKRSPRQNTHTQSVQQQNSYTKTRKKFTTEANHSSNNYSSDEKVDESYEIKTETEEEEPIASNCILGLDTLANDTDQNLNDPLQDPLGDLTGYSKDNFEEASGSGFKNVSARRPRPSTIEIINAPVILQQSSSTNFNTETIPSLPVTFYPPVNLIRRKEIRTVTSTSKVVPGGIRKSERRKQNLGQTTNSKNEFSPPLRIETVVPESQYKCSICEKELKTNFGLLAHINVAHTVKL